MVTVKPIRTEVDYNGALAEIGKIMEAEPGTPEFDRLEVLSALVESYEDIHYPMDAPDPIELIKFVMEQRGLGRSDLEPMIGSRGRVSEILNRKRPLTLEMIRRLKEGLNLPADVLVREYTLDDAA